MTIFQIVQRAIDAARHEFGDDPTHVAFGDRAWIEFQNDMRNTYGTDPSANWVGATFMGLKIVFLDEKTIGSNQVWVGQLPAKE